MSLVSCFDSSIVRGPYPRGRNALAATEGFGRQAAVYEWHGLIRVVAARPDGHRACPPVSALRWLRPDWHGRRFLL